MKPHEIKVGRFYVKKDESYVREVLGQEGDKVEWLSYELSNGTSWGDSSICEITSLATWAGREATPEEVARMDRTGAYQKMSAHNSHLMSRLAPSVLASISDEDLLEEVRRRGLI